MPGTKTGFPNGINLGPNDNQSLLASGLAAQQTLRIAANVASGETVVINGETYRVATAATDSTKTLGSELATTSQVNNPVATIAMTAHGLKGGDIIRIDNEIMLVLNPLNANLIQVLRAACNTTIATHAAAAAIFTEASPGGGGFPIGLNATLTPTAATPALVWAINTLGKSNVAAIQVDVNTVVVHTAVKPGGAPAAYGGANIAVSETLAGAGNAWDAANITGGRKPEVGQLLSIVPSANEVTAGKIVRVFPFVPVVEECTVRVTATAAVKAWDGAVTVSGNSIVIDNAGATDWAATDTIRCYVRPS